MEKMPIEKKKVITEKFRVSFPSLTKPKAFQDGGEAKFQISMLFAKKPGEQKFSDKEIRRAVMNAIIEKYGSVDKAPKNLRMPWNDGDDKPDLMGYPGHWVMTARSKHRPGVIGPSKEPIATEEIDVQVYAGCYARASLIAFAYGGKGTPYTPGIGLSLQSVWKIGDGKPFSGRKSAEEDFAQFDAVEDSSDDESSYASDTNSDDADF